MAAHVKDVKPLPHHVKRSLCSTRPTYREGRRATAVRVYTISQESCYLLITNVPAVGAKEDLQDACLEHGDISDFYAADGYETEQFTEAYIVRYARIQSARVAKKNLDEKSFIGSILHVCYAPEFETVEETREKLLDRQRYVAFKTGQTLKSSLQRRKRRAEPPTHQAMTTFFPNQGLMALQQAPSTSGFNPLFNDEPLSFKKPEQAKAEELPSSLGSLEMPERAKTEELPSSSGSLEMPERTNFEEVAPKRCALELAQQSFEKTVSVIRETIKNAYAQNLSARPQSAHSSSGDAVPAGSETEAEGYDRTMSAIRGKMRMVAVPNVDVLLRKRKP